MGEITMTIRYNPKTDRCEVSGVPPNRTMTLGMLERARHTIEKGWDRMERGESQISIAKDMPKVAQN